MRSKVNNPEYYKHKFIKKSNIRHNYKYDYSKVIYINSIEKVEVVCKLHGSFYVRPDAHIRKVGCPHCNGGIKYTKKLFIEMASIKHNYKYDYSKVVYINSTQKVEVICKLHGSFYISPCNHLIGQACSKCSGVHKKNTIQFIEESNKIHNYIYDYSLSDYINNKTKLKIICQKHGIFEQIPKDHLKGHGCKFCKIDSKGEKIIESLLINLNLEYFREFRFKNCTSNNNVSLPFDFYIPKLNLLIEYDGIQHYEPVKKFGGIYALENLKINDQRRNIWCTENNYTLIRIKYNNVNSDLNYLISYLNCKISDTLII